jgi:folylpolyglutamate synthase/dihydropteroate synthase
MQRLAAKWEKSCTASAVTVENSVKDAMDTVRSKYDHRGAQILVVGSVYQAGAVIVMLSAETKSEDRG